MLQYLCRRSLTGVLGVVLAGSCLAFEFESEGQHSGLGTHEHGVGDLTLAVDGDVVEVVLQVPTIDLVGFERPLRDNAEHAAVADRLAALAGGNWLAFHGARCELAAFRVELPAAVRPDSAAVKAARQGEQAGTPLIASSLAYRDMVGDDDHEPTHPSHDHDHDAEAGHPEKTGQEHEQAATQAPGAQRHEHAHRHDQKASAGQHHDGEHHDHADEHETHAHQHHDHNHHADEHEAHAHKDHLDGSVHWEYVCKDGTPRRVTVDLFDLLQLNLLRVQGLTDGGQIAERLTYTRRQFTLP